MPQARVAQHLPEVAAGLRVVGDVRDPVGGETAGERGHQRVARVLWDPPVDAVGDDVVEFAEPPVGEVAQIALAQLDVVKPDSAIAARPSSIGAAARSTPTARMPGVAAAIAIRLPPAPAAELEHARRRIGSGGSRPCRIATVASRSGCVCAYG